MSTNYNFKSNQKKAPFLEFIFCLFLIVTFGYGQNTSHFIALDKTGALYDVNPTTCTYTALNFCSNIASSGAAPLSIAISGNILYIVDSTGKLWKETYNATGNCVLIGNFSSTSGYYGLTVDPNGVVYAATGSKIETYNPSTNTFAVVGTLPTQWKIGGDLLYYQGQLYMACKNLDLIRVNLGNLAASTVQLTFPAGSSVFGFASVSVPCSNNQAYAISNVSTTSTNLLPLNILSGTVGSASCNLPFNVYDTASVSENGSYTPPAPPSVVVSQPSCSSTTGTVTVSSIIPGYHYSIDGITYTNTTGIFGPLLPGTNYSITAQDPNGCISTATTGTIGPIPPSVTPTFTIPGPFCSGSTITPLPLTSNNGITGSWLPALNNATTTIYTFTPNPNQCGLPTTLSIVINPTPAMPTVVNLNPVCPAIIANLNLAVTSLPMGVFIFKDSSGTVISNPTSVTAGTYTVVDSIASTGCTSLPATIIVTIPNCGCVNPPIVTLSSSTGSTCQTSPITVNGNTFSGSATNVTVTHNGHGIVSSGTTINASPFSFTYTPSALDANTTVLITFTTNNPLGNPCTVAVATYSLAVSLITPTFTQIPPVCIGGSLSGTGGGFQTTSNNGITGSWSPAFNNLATMVYTFTPNLGQCAVTTTMTVTITPPTITPTFTQIPSVCIGGSLSGTGGGFQTTSNNGITGSWSPAFNNLATTVYTFTPNFGQCAATTTMTVTITPPTITPTFTQIPPICIGGSIVGTGGGFQTTSNNGITGSWSPAFNNLATTVYTFTPNFGQCATTTPMTITVNPNVAASFSITNSICNGTAAPVLPLTSSNGITGSWSPATISNTSNGTYTFTPTTIGQYPSCSVGTTVTVTITAPNITPVFTPVSPICSGGTLTALPTTSTNGIVGTWSPAFNTTTTTTTYTFTPNAGQCAVIVPMTIVVNSLPTVTQPQPIFQCSNGISPTAVFNLTINEAVVTGGFTGVTVTYYHSLLDAQTPNNPITTPQTYIGTDNEVVYIRVENSTTGCYSTTTQLLRVTQGPVAITPQALQYCDPNNDGFGIFNLDDATNEITGTPLGAPLPIGVSVTYHETQTDALLGANPLASPYNNINQNIQTIYVRVFYTLTGCANFVNLQLIVNPTPVATVPDDYKLCDYTGAVGYETFNLTSVIPQVLGSINPTLTAVSFYTSQSNADAGTNPIVNVSSYVNTTINTQTIYVRVETIATGCYDVVPLQLIVNPLPQATQPNYPQYSLCDTKGLVGFETFDLASQIAPIVAGQTGMDVTFYPSLLNAQNGTNVITNLHYTNVPIYVQTLGIRVTNHSTGCYVISTMDIRVEPLPTLIPPTQPYTVCDDNQDGYANFDLASLLLGLLNGITTYTVTFHETLPDANSGYNPINTAVPYFSIDPFVQTIYVRAQDNGTGCYSILPIELNADPSPVAPINLNPITVCDQDNNPQNASTSVNLTQQTAAVLAQQTGAASNYSVTYYTTQILAQGGTFPIIPATNYIGTNLDIIWVRVENKTTHCYGIGSFQLTINTPLLLTTPAPLSLCDVDANVNDQHHAFDLTVRDIQINQGTGYGVTYYPSLLNAQNNTNAISATAALAYVNIPAAVQTLGVVVTTAAGCKSLTTLDIRVLPIPVPNTNPPALAPKCDDTNTGDLLEVFDLTANAAYIINGDPNVTLHYYATQADAAVPQNEILTPTAALVGTNVWIRVENNRVDYQGNHCYVLVEQPLKVNPLPTVVQPLAPYRACDDNTDGISVFDLTNPQLAIVILGATQLPADYTVSYYLTALGANPATNTGETPLPNSYTNVTPNAQNIYIRVVNTTTGCSNTGILPLAVEAYATATGPQTFNKCDNYTDPYDGVGLVDLTSYATAILNGQNPAVFLLSYYTTQANAVAGINALTLAQAQGYETKPDTDRIWVKVENSSNLITPLCFAITTIDISVERYPNPIINAPNGVNSICVDFITNQVVRPLTLDSGIAIPGNYTFEWFEAGAPSTVIGAGATYTVDTASAAGATRDYTVHVTSNSALGCDTTSAAFQVLQSGQAVILVGTDGYTVSNAFSDSQIITVLIDGYGTYEYSLDDGPRQASNVFENVSLGTHVIHVWDTEGGVAYSCDELVIDNVQIIDYPHYFTPNGDGIHDTWNIVGLAGQPGARIYIFDRYGKLLKQISSTGAGWDGTFNGHLMPSDDYWFTVDYIENASAKQFKAHFAMKR